MRTYLVAIVLGLAALVSCNTTPTPIAPENDPDDTSIVELAASEARTLSTTAIAPKVVPVTDKLLELVVRVSKSNGEIVFTEQAPLTNKLEVGSILVGKPSPKARQGFLRKITKLEQLAGQIRVQTQAAKLNEVFTDGGFRVKRKLRLADADYLLLPNGQKQRLQGKSSPKGVIFPVNIDFCPVNLDGNKNTKNDQICVSGSVDLDLDFDFVFRCKGFLCSKPYLDTNVTITETANLTVEGELSRTINKTVPLGTVVLPVITIPVAFVPLVFVPKISLSASLDGEVSVDFNWTANQEMSFTAGVELEDGKFDLYSNFSKDLKTSNADFNANMNVEARVEAEASVLVFGVGGPTATLGGFVEFDAQTGRAPLWTLEAGLDVSLGLELDLLGLFSTEKNWEIFEKRWTIAEAANSKPTIVIQSPLNGETLELYKTTITSGTAAGATYFTIPKIDIDTNDAEDGAGCCEVEWQIGTTQTNRTSAGSGHRLTDYNLFNPPSLNVIWITATATDSSGASTTKTWNFAIEECKRGDAVKNTGCPMNGSGTLFEGEFFQP
jgi:hypothetical protein